ncbi:MAG: hypothetical protein MJ000_03950 [Bacteroidales bacterium]|nr:hypothetical protein [Bacteroidales bacterium]
MKNIISNKENIIKTWRFSLLDMACGDMIIKAIWIYNKKLDTELMSEKLSVLLEKYPFLAGRLKSADGISCSNEGCPFDVVERPDLIIKVALKSLHIYDDFSQELIVKDFKTGKSAPITFRVTNLRDGAVLGVQVAHICVDGHTLYRMLHEWALLCQGKDVDIQQKTQLEFPEIEFMSKSQTAAILERKNWTKLGFKDIFKMMFYGMSQNSKASCTPLLINGDKIRQLKAFAFRKTGVRIGTNALLSAIVLKTNMILNEFNGEKDYSLVTVTDLRGRYRNIAVDFIGNASNNIVTNSLKEGYDIFEIAKLIQVNVNDHIENKDGMMDERIDLSLNALKYKLPYVGFDLPGMNAKTPTTLYVNDQRKMPVYDLNFGSGKPVIAIPNDLPDMVKIWPVNDGKESVLLFFRGYIAKNIIDNGGVDEIFKELIGA